MNEAAPWTRPYFWRSDARAMLLYFVFGEFPQELKLDIGRHGSAGLPAGITMHRFDKNTLAHWEGHPLRGALGELLRDDDPETFKAARAASECIMLRGEIDDSESLEYLRDTLGVVGALLDVGGTVVVDPQTLALFSANAWRERYADGGASPREHVLILAHDEDDGAWVRTRGMRKFARPDISIRGVPQAEVERAGALAMRLVELQAQGMRFVDGTALEIDGVPTGMTAHLAGSLEDPQFNNRHVEFVWPG
ncbi:MAG TPA: hypothetical protein VJ727_02765 [Rhodanobacteraceae bacterium]|nr:hypothetical protein [Rhodanobacteraceae bacterium]